MQPRVTRSGTSANSRTAATGSQSPINHPITNQSPNYQIPRLPNSENYLPLLDGPGRIRRPLAPRSRVELRPGHARVFEGEQVVAGGDARPAVADDPIAGHVADRRGNFRSQVFRCAEQPLVVQVPLKEVVRRARNVAAHLVDRLGIAAIPLGRTGVDETRTARTQVRCDLLHADRHVPSRRSLERSWRPAGLAGLHGSSFSPPLLEPAVEDRNGVVAEPSQHPPEPAGEHAVLLIVGDHLHTTRNTETAERLREDAGVRQRVASVRP